MEKVKVDTGPLRERNRQRTHERIVKAAAALFRDSGYDHTTMDAIASLAEVSRATLFNYFPTKDALLVPFLEDVLDERIRPLLDDYLAQAPGTFDALRFLFMAVYHEMLIVPDIDQALKREILRPKPFSDEMGEDESGFLKILSDLLRYGQVRGDIRLDMSAERLASYFGSLYGMVIFKSILQAEISVYTPEIEDLIRFIRSGLQPE